MNLIKFNLFIFLLLTGCTNQFTNLKETVNYSFSNKDVNLTKGQIAAIPYASIYAKIGDSPQAFIVLAYADPSFSKANEDSKQLKWISAGKEMLVTQNGRIIKTVNLPQGNLVASFSEEADPLSLGLLKKDTPKSWTRRVNWQPNNHYDYLLSSSFINKGFQEININGDQIKTILFNEKVKIPSLNLSFVNQFWIDPNSGSVIMSKQFPAPKLDPIQITFLKSFAM